MRLRRLSRGRRGRWGLRWKGKLNSQIVRLLLDFRPCKRLILFIGRDEVEIERPQDARVIGDGDILVHSVDGTTDFYDLNQVERIKIDDDFGFDELRRMLKE